MNSTVSIVTNFFKFFADCTKEEPKEEDIIRIGGLEIPRDPDALVQTYTFTSRQSSSRSSQTIVKPSS